MLIGNFGVDLGHHAEERKQHKTLNRSAFGNIEISRKKRDLAVGMEQGPERESKKRLGASWQESCKDRDPEGP